jgi:hypothetical protein
MRVSLGKVSGCFETGRSRDLLDVFYGRHHVGGALRIGW